MSFIKATAIRAAKTAAQCAIAIIGTSTLISDIDFCAIVSTCTVATILSILSSIVTGLPEVEQGGIN